MLQSLNIMQSINQDINRVGYIYLLFKAGQKVSENIIFKQVSFMSK